MTKNVFGFFIFLIFLKNMISVIYHLNMAKKQPQNTLNNAEHSFIL